MTTRIGWYYFVQWIFVCVVSQTIFGAPKHGALEWQCELTVKGRFVLTECTGVSEVTLPEALKQVKSDTTNLTITNSDLKHLKYGDFNLTNLASVQWVLIGPCGISSIDNSAFFGLRNLVYISVIGNPFFYIPRTKTWAQQLPFLRELHIHGSNVKVIETGAFGIGTPEVLDLSGNFIVFVEDESFRNAESVTHLDLSNNWLKIISDPNFYGLKNLKLLDLSNNIEVFDTTYIPEKPFAYLPRLENLNIANTTRTTNLPKKLLTDLPFLKHVNFSSLHFKEFPKNILSPVASQLLSLDLSFNELGEILAEDFQPFSRLNELYMKASKIISIEDGTFSFMKHITILDLSDNPHLSLSDSAFRQLKRLAYVNLRGLLMGKLADSFFQGLENIKEANLADNNLTQISVECLDPLVKADVDLSNNPWLCDCLMLPLKQWLVKRALNFNITCASPPEYKGQRLQGLKNGTLCRVPHIKGCCRKVFDIYEGNDVTASCFTWGDPAPVVTWSSQSGNPLPANQTVLKDKGQTVTILDVDVKNSGNFSCNSSNGIGSTVMHFELNVMQRPVLKYAEIIAIASVGGIFLFAIIWLGCFLRFKQKYFVYKPYIDDDSHEHARDYYNRGVQVRFADD